MAKAKKAVVKAAKKVAKFGKAVKGNVKTMAKKVVAKKRK